MKCDMRAVVVAAIFVYFGAAYGEAVWRNDRDQIKTFGTVIETAFVGAWGYYIGSSKGSQENGAALRDMVTAPPIPPPAPRPDLDIPEVHRDPA